MMPVNVYPNIEGTRILITGGSSYLGQHLVPAAIKASSATICYTYYRHDPLQLPQGRQLNILDEMAVDRLVRSFQPDTIIHTVGSNRSADMQVVIEQGTRHITQAAAAINARLIHLSTDSIFSGNAAPYDESAAPTPVNAYGRAKAAAEAMVCQHHNHIIIRTSLIYGLRLLDHGTAWMKKALEAGQPVKLFDNQRRNPIWVETLSQACLELVTHDYVGILNVAGRQVLSRAEFALRMLDWWGIGNRATLIVGPSEGDEWPLDCELDLRQAIAILSTPLPGVDAVLESHQ